MGCRSCVHHAIQCAALPLYPSLSQMRMPRGTIEGGDVEQATLTPYTIFDFVEWEASKQLIISPRFQRRDVWSAKAKSYLIDTILRSMPVPPLFVRLIVDPAARRPMREVVDGQQRLRAILGYLRGDFTVMRVHNSEHGGKSYWELPEEVRREFLSYQLGVYVLQNVSDAEVLGIFARLNTYTVTLKAQELRNASYFGAFKQTIYEVARRHLAFWRNYRILTDKGISRMLDAELVSVLIVTMMAGIRQTKAADLKEYYEDYDDEFPSGKQLSDQFDEVIDLIGDLLSEDLASSHFRGAPLFYSLFTALYDARFGLPGSSNPRIEFTLRRRTRLRAHLLTLNELFDNGSPAQEHLRFLDANRRATADPSKRRIRHEHIWKHALLPSLGD